MHEHGVFGRDRHQLVVDAIGASALRRCVRRRCSSPIDVQTSVYTTSASRTAPMDARERARRRARGAAEFVEVREKRFARAVRRGRPERDGDAHHDRGFRKRRRDVIAAVADVGEPQAGERIEALFDREQVREALGTDGRRRRGR